MMYDGDETSTWTSWACGTRWRSNCRSTSLQIHYSNPYSLCSSLLNGQLHCTVVRAAVHVCLGEDGAVDGASQLSAADGHFHVEHVILRWVSGEWWLIDWLVRSFLAQCMSRCACMIIKYIIVVELSTVKHNRYSYTYSEKTTRIIRTKYEENIVGASRE